MDLHWGFNNIQIREGNEEKAAFITAIGLYEPTVMQFRLCNTPSTFQRIMDAVLSEEKVAGHIKVYINDIMVHTKDSVSNWYWMRYVLGKLKENSLCCRLVKCAFKVEETDFLGMVIGRGRVRINLVKVEAITKERPPMTKKGV
jgi:hypothetical protein